MTDYTKLIKDLREEAEFDHNHKTLSILLCAADALERLKGLLNDAISVQEVTSRLYNTTLAERDALQATIASLRSECTALTQDRLALTAEVVAQRAKLEVITKEAETNQKWAFLEWRDKAERLQGEVDQYKTQWADWSSSLDSVMKQRNDLQAKLDAMEKREPIAWGAFHFGGKHNGKLYSHCDSLERLKAYIEQVHQSSDGITLRAAPLYASPVVQHPQAQQEVDELAFEIALAELVDKICPGLDSGDLLDDARTASMKLTHMIEPAIGGRESVEDALEIVESFGPGVAGVNDSYARQILLAAEVKRLRAVHPQATEPAWWPIESAPEGELVATVWSDTDGTRYSFDYLEDGVWQNHFNDYEHLVIAGAPGRAEDAPYTHWMPLPAAPAGGQQPLTWQPASSPPPESAGEVLVRMADGRCEIAWPTYWHGSSNAFAQWTFRDPDEDEQPVEWMTIPEHGIGGQQP